MLDSALGLSINYVSTFEGGGGTKMLMVTDARGKRVIWNADFSTLVITHSQKIIIFSGNT